MKKCLSPLLLATKCWEADREPTLHTVIRELWNIKTKLDQLSTTGDGVKMFARNLQRNINKRFKNCGCESLLFCLAHWLDPDLRGLILKQYRGVYERTVAEIKRICSNYEPEQQQVPEQRRANDDDNEDDSTLTGAQQLKKRLRLIADNENTTAAVTPTLSKIDIEVMNYERFVDNEDSSDICTWWRKNGPSFPLLERLARKILSIPASSSSSERVFSAGTRVGLVIDLFPTS